VSVNRKLACLAGLINTGLAREHVTSLGMRIYVLSCWGVLQR